MNTAIIRDHISYLRSAESQGFVFLGEKVTREDHELAKNHQAKITYLAVPVNVSAWLDDRDIMDGEEAKHRIFTQTGVVDTYHVPAFHPFMTRLGYPHTKKLPDMGGSDKYFFHDDEKIEWTEVDPESTSATRYYETHGYISLPILYLPGSGTEEGRTPDAYIQLHDTDFNFKSIVSLQSKQAIRTSTSQKDNEFTDFVFHSGSLFSLSTGWTDTTHMHLYALVRQALDAKDVPKLQTILSVPDIDFTVPFHIDEPVMQWACRSGNKALLQALLNVPGINVNDHTHLRPSPLHIDFRGNEDNYSPLHTACYMGHQEITVLLLAHGADVNARSKYGDTPLHMACYKGHTDIVSLLLAVPEINAHQRDGCESTPLHGACAFGWASIVLLLLATKGCDVNAQDAGNCTPLRTACSSNHVEVIRILLSVPGIDVNMHAVDNSTPFHSACYYAASCSSGRHSAALELLLCMDTLVVDPKARYIEDLPMMTDYLADPVSVRRRLRLKHGFPPLQEEQEEPVLCPQEDKSE